MGWGIVPDIKDENIVCQEPCTHRDCAANREQWGEGTCRICGKGFEAGQRFYYETQDSRPTAVHADCLEEEVEKTSA